jgi:hypothetical protein
MADQRNSRTKRIRGERVAATRRYLVPIVLAWLVLAVGSGIAGHLYVGLWWPGPLLFSSIWFKELMPSPREVAWRRGAEGERIVGTAIDALTGPEVRALHDRLIPRSKANIDHLVIAPSRCRDTRALA